MRYLDKNELIERSIIKKYRRQIWRPFVRAIDKYQLISTGDKIAVCISGGKDSFLMAKCFQELKKRSPIKFELEFLVMNPGYSTQNMELIIQNARLLKVPIKVFETNIFEAVDQAGGSPCYLCARMRRGHLYKNAQNLSCNKIALAHHMDDAIETVLLSMFYGSEFKTMMPKLKSANFEGMELIRPMYMIREKYIKAWAYYNSLEFLRCACKITQRHAQHEESSKRFEIKELIASLEKDNPNIVLNIFTSMHNVNLDAVIAYRKGDKKHSFLDEYSASGENDDCSVNDEL
ncbi:MAG TPA: tRNA 2-thiocytidine biosynthesis protein TtcA [Clostridiales bacterium]|nr:tRNA 2-thiocytidine biosynthesis protein TtcA [Clostridiales bacterium]